MFRLISALVLVILIVTPTLGQQSLVGTYKLVSQDVQVNGAGTQHLGKAPHGYLVLTPTHFIYFFTAENRKFGTSADEKAALLDSMVGFAGTYRIEGDKFIGITDVSWTETMNGKTQLETWQLSGNRLTKTLGPIPWPRDLSKTLIRQEVWEKIE